MKQHVHKWIDGAGELDHCPPRVQWVPGWVTHVDPGLARGGPFIWQHQGPRCALIFAEKAQGCQCGALRFT